MFDFQFIDDEYAKKFGQEQHISKLADVFSVLAIFISCLDLFDLASFIAEQQSREIGIRKRNGCFSVDYLANAYERLRDTGDHLLGPCSSSRLFSHERWLGKYEYRIDMPWWIFLVTCFGALLRAVATVSYQSTRTAMTKPIREFKDGVRDFFTKRG